MNHQQAHPRCITRPIPLTLRVTAQLLRRRFVVEFDSYPVKLPCCRHSALLTLIKACQERTSGYASLKDFDVADKSELLFQTICRLRQDIDAACGKGVGMSLIETCGSCTYVLNIEPTQIEIDPNLIELAPVHLPLELVERLIDNAARFS